jgi:membrane protein YqaA with SNARE-associated domain
MDHVTSLWALFTASFLAATLLPGGSEAVLFGVLKMQPELAPAAIAVATAGNTLGGLSSYVIGRILPRARPLKGLAAVQRYGSPILLFAWVPLVGDALCVAAGWLRVHAGLAALYMGLGKLARYLAIAAFAL